MESILSEEAPPNKKVTHRKEWLTLIFILLIVLGVLFFKFWPNSISEKSTAAYKPSDNYFCNTFGDDSFIPNNGFKDKCYEALSKKKISICDEIPKVLGRESCSFAFASEFNNPKICSEYFLGDSAESCISRSVSSLEDLDLCQDLSYSWKSACYLKIAKELKSSNICSEFTDTLGERGTNICYSEVAHRNGDIAVCNSMPASEDRYFSKEGCWSIVAEKNKDKNICDTIINQKEKDACFFSVALASSDLSICDYISEEFGKNGCYMDVAVPLKTATICDGIKNNYQTDTRCYTPIASLTGDTTICDKTADPLACKLAVVKTHPDISICKAMPEGWYAGHCYLNVAVRLQNPSYCVDIKDPGGQSSCYGFLAILKKDSALCDQVALGTFQNNCRATVASVQEDCSTLNDQDLKQTCEGFLTEVNKNWRSKDGKNETPISDTPSKIRMRTGIAMDQAYCGNINTDNLSPKENGDFTRQPHEITNLDCFTSSLKSCFGAFLTTTGNIHSGFLTVLGKEADDCIIQSKNAVDNLNLQCKISKETIDKVLGPYPENDQPSASAMSSLLLAIYRHEDFRSEQGFSCEEL